MAETAPVASLETCDQELRRWRIVARSAPDVFTRGIARIRIDALLEQRLALMWARDHAAAAGAAS